MSRLIYFGLALFLVSCGGESLGALELSATAATSSLRSDNSEEPVVVFKVTRADVSVEQALCEGAWLAS